MKFFHHEDRNDNNFFHFEDSSDKNSMTVHLLYNRTYGKNVVISVHVSRISAEMALADYNRKMNRDKPDLYIDFELVYDLTKE